MKFLVDLKRVQEVLRVIKGILPAKPLMPEATGIFIRAEGSKVYFIANGPNMGVEFCLASQTAVEGDCLIDGIVLFNALSPLQVKNQEGNGTGPVTFSLSKDGTKLNLTSKTFYPNGKEIPNRRVLPSLGKGYFSELKKVEDPEVSFELSTGKLSSLFDSVYFAASPDTQQQLFNSVLLRFSGNKIYSFATDGICLAECSLDIPFSLEERSIVIPGNLANRTAKSFPEDKPSFLKIKNSILEIKTEDLTIVGSLLNEEFPNYKDVLPDYTKKFSINRSIVVDSLGNLAQQASSVANHRVSVSLSGEGASLVCGHFSNNEIPAEGEGTFEFDCNLRVLFSCLRSIPGETIELHYVNADKPVMFSSMEPGFFGNTVKTVVVPLVK